MLADTIVASTTKMSVELFLRAHGDVAVAARSRATCSCSFSSLVFPAFYVSFARLSRVKEHTAETALELILFTLRSVFLFGLATESDVRGLSQYAGFQRSVFVCW